MADRDDVGDNVGYGKPPRQHRFKPGKSGNPNGRPKGAKSLGDTVRAALAATIPIKEGQRKQRINAVEAALKRLVQQAVAGGNLRAIQLILQLAEAYPSERVTAVLAPDDQKMLADAIKQLSQAQPEGGDERG